MSDDDTGFDAIPTGWAHRTWKSVTAAGRFGTGLLERTFGRGGDDDARATRRAEKLADELGALKGLAMKFGQLASFLPTDLSESARQVLEKLQDQTEPMSFDRVRQVFREDFDREPTEMFDSFEHRPFAAASIGQVHRAQRDSRDLAVKVQYPGVREAIETDLGTVETLARTLSLGLTTDATSLAEELRDRVREECDYRREAANQRLFRELLDDRPDCFVPDALDHPNSRRILCSDYVDGDSFRTFRQNASRDEKDRAGRILFETCFFCLFKHCIFNADPHPGNYLFVDSNVAFLDFGCIRVFDPDMIRTWKRLARAITAGDRRRFEQLYPELGFVPDPDDFDWDHAWRMLRHLYKPFLRDEPFTITHDHMKETYRLMTFDNPNRFKMNVPREWLFLNRLQWGLFSVLAQLEATAPWHDIWRDLLAEPLDPTDAPSR